MEATPTTRLSPRVRRQGRYWQGLTRGSVPQQRQLMRFATPDQVDAMSEIVYNVLRGHVPLTPQVYRQLASRKQLWRNIGDPRRRVDDRRKWLQQGGGKSMGLLLSSVRKGLRRGVKQGQKGLRRGVKKNLRKGLRRGVTKTLRQGLRRGVTQGVQQGLRRLQPTTVDDDDDPSEALSEGPSSRAGHIQQLEQDIARMERNLQSI